MAMFPQSLSTIVRTTIGALALAAASTAVDAAFINNIPDPFLGTGGPNPRVVLTTAAGTAVELPGVGPGGVPLYAKQFELSNFRFVGFGSPNAGYGLYRADFFAEFLLADGVTPAGGSVTLTNASPEAANFGVQFNQLNGDPRGSNFDPGVFDMILNLATFDGTYNNGVADVAMVVSLAANATARVSITNNPNGSGYVIDYLSAFVIQGQYTLNSGDPINVPNLGDANGQPLADVPLPATAVLMIPGLLGVFGLRRRRAAVAV